MKYRPYVSIDIETTGLGKESNVLEIGAVFDNFSGAVDSLKTIRIPVRWDTYRHAEPYALMLNANLIKQICKNEIESYSPGKAAEIMVSFLEECQLEVDAWDKANGFDKTLKGKIQLAGKNLAGFDIPMLDRFTSDVSDFWHQRWIKTKMHRVIDAGSLFYSKFGYIPNLTEINKTLDRNEVTHNAVDDAKDVVHAIRSAVGFHD
jgi:hypothetical protein